jgi:penicillin-binding protein 1A
VVRILVAALVTLLAAILLAAAGAGLLYAVYSADLPDVATLRSYQPSTVSRLLARDGREIAQFYVEKRIPVPLDTMPPYLLQAVIATEDAEFFRHGGVDLSAIARALLADLWARSFAQGGSTITQQVARAMFLTAEKSIPRKVKEWILAYRIDQQLTKREILELYLNHIYFGSGAYGVEAASNIYFGKPVADISLLEAAVLAGLPPAPNAYSPLRNKQRSLERAGHVLNRMVEEKYLSREQADAARKSPLDLTRGERVRDMAPYFTDWIRREVEQKYGSTSVFREGLTIATTIDLSMQGAAHLAVRKGLRAVDKRRGWRGPAGHVDPERPLADPTMLRKILDEARGRSDKASDPYPEARDVGMVEEVSDTSARVRTILGPVVILPAGTEWVGASRKPKASNPRRLLAPGDIIWVQRTTRIHQGIQVATLDQEPIVQGAFLGLDYGSGEVLAMVGGYDFVSSKFNRATQAMRQPGSAFKLFTYLAALEKGYSPDDLIPDTPVEYIIPVPDPTRPGQMTKRVWRPTNYEADQFYGLNSLRDAFAHSRNVSAVRLIEDIGVGPVIDAARSLGITSTLRRELALTLGVSEVTMAEIASAYAGVADGGVRIPPRSIRYIADRQGTILERRGPDPVRALDEKTAALMTDMLAAVCGYGTAAKTKGLGRPCFGKTGTTDRFTDAWFVGWTDPYLAGVWVGMDDHTPLGHAETGAQAALPIWIDVMKTMLPPAAAEPKE